MTDDLYYDKYIKYKMKYIEIKSKYITISDLKNGLINYTRHMISTLAVDINIYDKHKSIIFDNSLQIAIYKDGKSNKITTPFTKISSIEWTWDNIKKTFSDNTKIMKLIVYFRQKLVNTLLLQIFLFFDKCKDKSNNKICTFIPSGSTGSDSTLLSNYDLTINGHFQISEIIKLFNDIIYSVFKTSSHIALDTNIHGYSFLIPKKINISNKIFSFDHFKDYYEIKTDDAISGEQDKWAYLRFYTLINNMKKIKEIQFNITDYNKFADDNKLNIKQKSTIYIRKMEQFEELIKTAADDISKKKDVIEALSFMNYYGDDTYFTQGAFIHVIGTMFYYKEKKIEEIIKFIDNKIYYIIHSLIENTAYFIYVYNNDKDEVKIINAIKYLQRFVNALNLLFNNELITKYVTKDVITKGVITDIKNFIIKLLELCNNIKKDVRNKSIGEIIEETNIKIKSGKINTISITEVPKSKGYLTVLKERIEDDIKILIINIISQLHKIIKIDGQIQILLTNILTDDNFYIKSILILLKCLLEIYKEHTTLTITYNNKIFSINKK